MKKKFTGERFCCCHPKVAVYILICVRILLYCLNILQSFRNEIPWQLLIPSLILFCVSIVSVVSIRLENHQMIKICILLEAIMCFVCVAYPITAIHLIDQEPRAIEMLRKMRARKSLLDETIALILTGLWLGIIFGIALELLLSGMLIRALWIQRKADKEKTNFAD